MSIPSGSLPKVSRTTLVDEVIGAIRRMVAEEGWSPGTKLPSEQELGRQLGVGRSTVREALRVLGHLGVVESRSGLGTYVVNQEMPHGRPLEHPQTPQGLYELYEFRRHLEVPAARAAAEHRTADQMAAIRSSWNDCAQAVLKNSPMEFARLDYRFHLSIVEASQNRFAIAAYKTIDAAFPQYVQLILGLGPLRSMLTFHDELIAAIEARNGDAAEAAALENFMETDVRVQLLLQAEKGPASAS
jgi:DNA-binding FadR family transcriptional regulator